jgi:rRNA maturation protein Nop10
MLPFLLLYTHMLKIETKFAKRREIAKDRLDVCKECERYIKLTTQCRECGCFMSVKTLWPSANCPLDKWESYKEER